MSHSVSDVKHSRCSGCSVCSNVCPVGAITIEPDAEGFPYPKINDTLCTDCGACRSVCAACADPASGNTNEPLCYAMMAPNEIREQCSSGGMFGLLAEHVLAQGGAVVGCAFSPELVPEHVLVTDPQELPKLYHSKYAQSRMGDIYKETRAYLKANPDKPLLFSGCPCHVAGLRLYLKKSYPNLILCDIICHGIASPKVFAQYLRELAEEHGSAVERLTFRDKLVYGWTTALSASFRDGRVYHRGDTDPYLRAYLKNLMLRPSCTSCRFTAISRQGDLTIGDFWGISKTEPSMNDTRGTSLVLVNNARGEEILSQLYEKCRRIKRMPLKAALDKQAHLTRPASSHPKREMFFRLLDHHTVEEAGAMALEDRYDIGLIGAWYFPNYGTTLTYYALHTVLEEMGYSVLMIDKPRIKENDIERRDNYARAFAAGHGYAVSEVFDIDDTMSLNDLCDTFMLGSDQMWTWTRCQQFGTYYFLDFARDDKKKIVYAGSFGKEDFFAPEEGRAKCAYHASRIDAISVREDIGVQICKKRFGLDAQFVLDPIFLLDFARYEALADASKRELPEKPYLMSYILDPTDGKRSAINRTAELLGLEAHNVLNGVPWMHKDNAAKLGLPHILENAGLEDVLHYYRHADFILTDSFHGSVMAILFRKPFLCIANQQRGIPRFHSLFGLLGLMDRLVYRPGEILAADEARFREPIDYDHVYEVIADERERCMQWLREALERPKAAQASDYDVLMREVFSLRRELKALKAEIKQGIQDENHNEGKSE